MTGMFNRNTDLSVTYLSFIFYLLIFLSGVTANSNIDSLLEKSRSAEGVQKFELLLKISEEHYKNKAHQKVIEYAEQALKNAIKREDEKAMASAENSNAWEVYCHSWVEFVFSKKKKLLEEWFNLKSRVLRAYEKANDQIGIVKICNDLMEGSYEFRYWLVRNWKEAKRVRDELIGFGERALAILSELPFSCSFPP